MLDFPMNPGETYMGVLLNEQQQPTYRIIKVPGFVENVDFDQAQRWAMCNNASLPDADEIAMFNFNFSDKRDFFWTCEVDERSANLIAVYNSKTHRFVKTIKTLKGAAIAVRRIPVN